jgi:hypothetical protein
MGIPCHNWIKSTFLNSQYTLECINYLFLFVQSKGSHVDHIVTKINFCLVNPISLVVHPIDLYKQIVWQFFYLYFLFLHTLVASFTYFARLLQSYSLWSGFFIKSIIISCNVMGISESLKNKFDKLLFLSFLADSPLN